MSRTYASKSSHWTPPSVSRKSSSSFKPPTVGIQPGTGRWQSTEETAGWRAPLPSEVGKSYISNSIQTKCDACESKGKEETPEVQTKLTVGEPGDKYEQEADRVAAQVMSMPDNSNQLQQVEEENNPVQRYPLAKSITPLVQRNTQYNPTLQREPARLDSGVGDMGGTYLPESTSLNFVTMKRRHINLLGDDKYGHWWTEIDGTESYGWWPKYRVAGLWETFNGVDGELNGVTSFGGTSTKDAHHGDSAPETFHPLLTKPKANHEQVRREIRNFANAYSGEWRWTAGAGQNCHTFQKSLMKNVGLKKP